MFFAFLILNLNSPVEYAGRGARMRGAPQEGGEVADCVVGLPLPLKVPPRACFAKRNCAVCSANMRSPSLSPSLSERRLFLMKRVSGGQGFRKGGACLPKANCPVSLAKRGARGRKPKGVGGISWTPQADCASPYPLGLSPPISGRVRRFDYIITHCGTFRRSAKSSAAVKRDF